MAYPVPPDLRRNSLLSTVRSEKIRGLTFCNHLGFRVEGLGLS